MITAAVAFVAFSLGFVVGMVVIIASEEQP